MTYQFSSLALLFIVNASIAGIFAVFGWSRRFNPGGRAFAFLLLAVGEWSLTGALEAAAIGEAGKIFWAKYEYLGIASLGFLWLLFAVEFARKTAWLSATRLILLGIIPVVSIGMVFTNDLHGLIWSGITPDTVLGYDLLVYRHGPWFWVLAAYNYILFIFGIVLLLRAFPYYTRLYRFQAWLLAVGAVSPMIGNFMYLFGLVPLPGLDLTHFGFTVSAVIFSLTVFRYKIFDIKPFARDVVIEGMSDGFVVMDEFNRIIDMNPAAERFFGSPAFLALGLGVEETAVKWSELTGFPDAEDCGITEVILGDRIFTVAVSPLTPKNGRVMGRVLLMSDVTKAREAQEVLKKTEERYRDLYENAPAAQISVDVDGIVSMCNERAVELLGNEKVKLVGRSIHDLIADATSGVLTVEEVLDEFRSGTSIVERELEMKRADSTTIWVSLTINPIRNAQGDLLESRFAIVDITRWKRDEERKGKAD